MTIGNKGDEWLQELLDGLRATVLRPAWWHASEGHDPSIPYRQQSTSGQHQH